MTHDSNGDTGARPTVSVLMNCYNCAEFLAPAIGSVFAQTYTDWEIVFWDNASEDRSAAIAKTYGDKLRYFRGERTVPLGQARNLAMSQARGRYLAFLDTDDLWLPEKLEKQVTLMKNTGAALCYTDSLRVDPGGKPILSYSHGRTLAEGDIHLPLIADCFIACSSCMIDAEVVAQTGPFDEGLDMVEEWDLWLRIVKGRRAALVPEELTHIRMHGSNASARIMESLAECEELFAGMDAPDEATRKAIGDKLDEIRLRRAIAAVVNLRPKPRGALTGLAGTILAKPGAFLRFAARYCSPSFLKLYWRKYFGG